jgi:hypothetical protein
MPILGVIASGISGNLFIPTGYLSWNTNFTDFSKLNMIADTISTSTISVTSEGSGHASNSGVAGYRYGNTTNGVGSQKFAYSNEAVSTLANSLPQFRFYATGGSNSGTAGYITGGATTGFAVRYRTIVKSPFSTDTPATLGTGFTQMGNANAYASNNHTAGYTFGGESDTLGAITDINKINYSNDAISNNIATMGVAGRSNGAVSNDGTAAYFGNGTGATSAIYKLTYSNDTRTTLSATFAASPVYFSSMCYRYQVAGYWGKGGSNDTTIQRLLYSNETMSVVISALTSEGSHNNGEISNNGVI